MHGLLQVALHDIPPSPLQPDSLVVFAKRNLVVQQISEKVDNLWQNFCCMQNSNSNSNSKGQIASEQCVGIA